MESVVMSPTDSTVIISRAGEQDVDQAVALFMSYFDFYNRVHDRQQVAEFIVERLQSSDSVLLLAWLESAEGQKAVGMAHVYPTFSTLSLARSWTLNDLYVSTDARGLGVGRALVQAVTDRAGQAGAAEVTLETAVDNSPARRLYQSAGFVTDGGFAHYALSLR